MTFSLFVWIRFKAPSSTGNIKRTNILETFPWLKRLVRVRGLQFFIVAPNFIIFYLFILSSLWGSPVGNRNITIVVVWILWWFILKAILVPLGGRLWCLMCPLPAPAEWLSRRSLTAVRYFQEPFKRLHHRFSGLQKDWPLKLRNIWLQNILFLVLISFGMILITRPLATALMFIIILVVTLVLSLIYRQRVFCLYLCPVGGFLGTYSMASMTEVRAIDPDVCIKHKEKTCLTGGLRGWACPWNQYVGKMNRNNHCGMCTECIKSCPKDNVGIFIRPFGSDKVLKGYDEMFNVIIMLVIAMAFSITMLGPWGFIKDAANVTESKQIVPFLVYLVVIWSAALIVFPGLFVLAARGGKSPDWKHGDPPGHGAAPGIYFDSGGYLCLDRFQPAGHHDQLWLYYFRIFRPSGAGVGPSGHRGFSFYAIYPGVDTPNSGGCITFGDLLRHQSRISGIRPPARYPFSEVKSHDISKSFCAACGQRIVKDIYGLTRHLFSKDMLLSKNMNALCTVG